jgi:hypothetical protein
MKRYLHSNDPLFDPVTLGYVLQKGDDPRSQQAITSARDQVLVAANSLWQEPFRLIHLKSTGRVISNQKANRDIAERVRNECSWFDKDAPDNATKA